LAERWSDGIAYQKGQGLKWPSFIKDARLRDLEWTKRLRGRRFDDPGLVVKFKKPNRHRSS
jgi:hypothetical protein